MQLINIGSPVSAGGGVDVPDNFWIDDGAPSSGSFGVNRSYMIPFVPKMNLLANRFSMYNAGRILSGNFVGAFYSADGQTQLANFDHDYTFTYTEEIVLSAELDLKKDELLWLFFNNKSSNNALGRVNTSSGRVVGESQFIHVPPLPVFDDPDSQIYGLYESETITAAPATIDMSEARLSAMSTSTIWPWMAFARKVS